MGILRTQERPVASGRHACTRLRASLISPVLPMTKVGPTSPAALIVNTPVLWPDVFVGGWPGRGTD